MDKYSQIVERIAEAAPAADREDIRSVAEVGADLARTIEQIGLDLDRIATALERLTDKLCG